MYLLVTAVALAHGPTFGALGVSVSSADTDEIWVLTDGWGLAHTTDGGGEWAWLCEESLGGETLYGVLAVAPGEAVVATRVGLRRVDAECGTTLVGGAPETAFYPGLAAYGAGWLALGIEEERGGLWSCGDDGCVATDLLAPSMFPKSVVADGDTAWATVVYEGTLVSELWRSDDGLAWTMVHTWPDGDSDPRILRAHGDRLLVWRRTRSLDDTPELLVSDDAGVTFRSTFEAGYYTDSTPGFLALDGGVRLLGSVAGARTWRSDDDGETWAEVSADVPAVRCGDVVGGVGWACADHLQDGFDLARTDDGGTWIPVACLESAVPAACAGETCDALLPAWQEAGSYGGGQCDTVVTPPDETPDEDPECACRGSGGAGALLLGVAWSGRRRRSTSARSSPPSR